MERLLHAAGEHHRLLVGEPLFAQPVAPFSFGRASGATLAACIPVTAPNAESGSRRSPPVALVKSQDVV